MYSAAVSRRLVWLADKKTGLEADNEDVKHVPAYSKKKKICDVQLPKSSSYLCLPFHPKLVHSAFQPIVRVSALSILHLESESHAR